MLSTVNHAMPMLGLLVCLIVMLTRKVNTRGAICIAKLNLYAFGWLLLLWADWGTGHTPVFTTVAFRLIMLVNNLLYIKQLTMPKPVSFRTLWPHKLNH